MSNYGVRRQTQFSNVLQQTAAGHRGCNRRASSTLRSDATEDRWLASLSLGRHKVRMKWCGHLVTFGVTLLLAGCGEPSEGPVTVVPGQGIPKVAEVSMSLSEIQDAVSDLKLRTYPEIGFPWQKDNGERRRLPLEKPYVFTAVSQSLGLYFSAYDRDKPVQSLIFFSDPNPIPVNSNVWFTGQLSCGISFANRRRVSREEVTAKFGEAAVSGVELRTNLWPLLQKGTSVSDKSGTGNGVENLYYPAEGISFCLQHDIVIGFDIREKIRNPETKK